MNLKILDGFGIFTDGKEQKGPFYICLEKEGALYINGAPLENGEKRAFFRISPSDLLEGESTVSIKVEGKRLPCQSLYRHGALVMPLAFPTEKVILSLLQQVEEMALRLQRAEEAISDLSARFLGPSLFDI